MRNEGQDCDFDKQKIKHYTENYFLCRVLSSICRSQNLVLRSSFITHPSIAFYIVFHLLFSVVTISSLRNEAQDCDYDKQKIKHYTESNRCVSNEWRTKDKIVTTANRIKKSQSCPSFLIHYSPIYYFLCSVLSSVCVVTILSFVPHSLLTHLWVSNEWGTKDNIVTTANRR
jgi:hypothetical protein